MNEREQYEAIDVFDLPVATDVVIDRGPGPKSAFAVRLETDVIEQLRALAADAGVGPTQLARQWIVERLEVERGQETFEARLERIVEDAVRRSLGSSVKGKTSSGRFVTRSAASGKVSARKG
jgi:hypothetical protein